MSTVKERVAEGAALLDANHPGWVNEINLNELNMIHCEKCILGQLYGDFIGGKMELHLFPTAAFDYGFDITGYDLWYTYADLLGAWKELITERL